MIGCKSLCCNEFGVGDTEVGLLPVPILYFAILRIYLFVSALVLTYKFYSDEKDVLILISNSGETQELKPVIQYANRNKITLIGIVSKKNSTLYRASDIKLFIPPISNSTLGQQF